MKKKFSYHYALFIVALIAVSCKKERPCVGGKTPTVKVFATGLNNPRGLKFGPDGQLYVAEAGIGGTNSTDGICDQVVFPIGPYLGSATGGRISRISHQGVRSTVTDNLPTSKANEIIGGDIEGVSDVEFIGNTLYALLAGAGCSHGVSAVPNGVVKVNPDGTWQMIADLSTWFRANPVAHPSPGDFEPDGTPYSMVSMWDELFIIEPNHGELLRVTTKGDIKRISDISATQGHIVPTSVTFHNGNFYVGNLNPFPIVEGSSKIYKITAGGAVFPWASGFTTVLGVAFDKQGRLYVLENTTGNQSITPNTGKIIRVNNSGSRDTIASGLNLPTAMTFGPDGKLYVSNVGLGPNAIGGGQILQIDLKTCGCDYAPLDADIKF